MNNYRIITLRERPELVAIAAEWFHSKWGVPAEAYLECMKAYLSGKTEYGWYICLYDESIVAGLGVIENDFHDRKDLTPNVCAVYAEEEHRKKGLAGNLLNKVVDDMRNKGVTPLYLVTDHIGFYERYGGSLDFSGGQKPVAAPVAACEALAGAARKAERAAASDQHPGAVCQRLRGNCRRLERG